jgi:phage terminase small subunit
MSGVKGRSGGSRPNTGGARPNSGPKPNKKQSVVPVPEGVDMLTFLQLVALGKIEAAPIQVRAAIAAVQYTHAKKEAGKKEDAAAKAAQANTGKFASKPPPKLLKFEPKAPPSDA